MAAASEVDLLLLVLADVADDQIAGCPVEGEAPRVAQPVGPDLRAPSRRGGEGVARRDRIPAVGLRRDPQHLGEQHTGVLAVVVGVALAAAIPDADVQIAFGAELELAAVVVGLGVVVDREHGACAAGLSAVRVPARAPVLDDPDVVGGVRVVDVEAPARRVVGREGHRQQSLLSRGCVDLRGDVEEGTGPAPAVDQDDDASRALDHEEPPWFARRACRVDGLVELPDPFQGDPARSRGSGHGRRARGGRGAARGDRCGGGGGQERPGGQSAGGHRAQR